MTEICEALYLKRRPAEALLSAVTALGFLHRQDGRHALTPLTEDYLLASSPGYFGFSWDLFSDNVQVFSLETLEQAILTDTPLAYGGAIFKPHEDQAELTRRLTRGIHSIGMAPAFA